METDEKLRAREGCSGGHLCHVCGYQYPNHNPSAKLRRSHRKNCRKPPATDCVETAQKEDVSGKHNGGAELSRGKEGGDEGNGPNGSALSGSMQDVIDFVENRKNAEHASPDCTGVQVVTDECSESCLIDCNNNSFEIALKASGTNLTVAGIDETQNEVVAYGSEILPSDGHLLEKEVSFDEYQDASPFLYQPESEDESTRNSESLHNLNVVSFSSSVTGGGISVQTYGLCEDQFSREPSMTDLSADSKVGNKFGDDLERTPELAAPEASLKLQGTDECSVSVNSDDVGMLVSRSDKASVYSESSGQLSSSNCLFPQKTGPLISDFAQSMCSRKVVGFMEGNVDILPGVVGSDSTEYGTMAESGTNFVRAGNEIKLIHTDNSFEDCFTEIPSQNRSARVASGVQLSVENTCQDNSVDGEVGYQNNLGAINVDGIPTTVGKDKCSEGILVKGNELDVSYLEKLQPKVAQDHSTTLVEEDPTIEKAINFSKEEISNEEIDPKVHSELILSNLEDKVSICEEPVTLLMDQESCTKNPFSVDDTKSDDLFELASDSCDLETPNIVEFKQQLDSISATVDQLTASNETTITEGQHYFITDDCIPALSSTVESGPAVSAEDVSVSDHTDNISLLDASTGHNTQENRLHSCGNFFVPSQAAPVELCAVPMSQEINAVISTDIEQKPQSEDTSAKDINAVLSTNDVEEKQQTEDSSAKETNALESTDGQEGNKNKDTAAESTSGIVLAVGAEDMSVRSADLTRNICLPDASTNYSMRECGAHTSGVASVPSQVAPMELSTVPTSQGIDTVLTTGVEEKKQTEDTIAKETIAVLGTDNVEEKRQTGDTGAKEINVIESTDGWEGDKQNEDIAAKGARLNSDKIHVPLKVLLAEASVETKEKKTTTKDRVLSFRRRVSKDDESSAKTGSPKAGTDHHYWNSPARLPDNNVDKQPKGRKQPWVPFICCHSIH